MIEVVAGGDFTSWAVDMKKNGRHGIVIGGLTYLKDQVVHHAGSDLAWNFLGDDPKEIDLGDALFLGFVSFDELFLEVRGRFDMGRAREKGVIAGKEEEIGEEAASEQNQTDDEKKLGMACHGKGKDASDWGAGQGGVESGRGGAAESPQGEGESSSGGFWWWGQRGFGRGNVAGGYEASDYAF